MKRPNTLLSALVAAALIQGCGSPDLLNDSNDVDTLQPDPPVELPNRPSPPEDALVIRTSATEIYDASTKPILLRGVNLQYGDDPDTRLAGIAAIAETGANVVRLQLRANTTEEQLRAALDAIVDAGMIAMPMLWEEEGQITCTENEEYLQQYTQELWFDRWLPVLVEGKYQPYLMINIANEWGPMNIFDANSSGYSAYIDAYKQIIREFRDIGFKVPLVIDAPHCGQDYHAFLADRGLELQAADVESNIVLSAHAYHAKWNTSEKVIAATDALSQTNVPFIIGEFGGSDVFGAASIDHVDLISKGVGDDALVLNVPWTGSGDLLAYRYDLDESLDLTGATVSGDVYIPARYVEDGQLTVQMYVRDNGERFASFGTLLANDSDLRGNAWNSLSYSISDDTVFTYMEDGFDLSSVNAIGFEVSANNKPAIVAGNIKFDNIKVETGGIEPPMYQATFDGDTEGWAKDWTAGTQVEAVEGNMQVTQDWATSDNFVISVGGGNIVLDLSQPLTFTLRMFVPQEYEAAGGIYFKIFTQHGDAWVWAQTEDKFASDIEFGAWNEIAFTEQDWSTFGNLQKVGIQFGGVSDANLSDKPILFDAITVTGEAAGGTGEPPFYYAKFNADEEGWTKDWTAGTSVSAEEGNLVIAQDWTSSDNFAVTVGGAGLNIDTSGPLTIKTRVFLPESYAGQDNLYFKVYVSHGDTWAWGQTEDKFIADFVAGDWNEITFENVDWTTFGALQKMGIQFGGIAGSSGITDPLLIDYVAVMGEGQSLEGGAQLGLISEYEANFVGDTEGWGKDWTAGTTLSTDTDNLIITQDWSQSDSFAIYLGGGNTDIDMSVPVTMSVRFYLPAEYASDADNLYFKGYVNHGDSWAWAETPTLMGADLSFGAWNEVSFEDMDWSTFGALQKLGILMGGVSAGRTEPVTIDYIKVQIKGLLPPELETLFNLSFDDAEQADAWTLDYVGGGLNEGSLAEAKGQGFGITPFGWIAWSWKGNGTETQVLDMSTSEGSVELTPRGNEIVNGPGGIKASSVAAEFTND